MLDLPWRILNLRVSFIIFQQAFVYISTAYSHCYLDYIEEKYYKSAMEVDKVLNLVEMLDDNLLEHMKTK